MFAAFVIVAIEPIIVDCMSSLCIDDARDCSCCCDCLIFTSGLALLSGSPVCLGLVWVLSAWVSSLFVCVLGFSSSTELDATFCGQVDLL